MKFCHEILETPGYHMVKTRSLHPTWAWIGTRSWWTDRRTDRITVANTRYSYLYKVSRVKKWYNLNLSQKVCQLICLCFLLVPHSIEYPKICKFIGLDALKLKLDSPWVKMVFWWVY